MSPEQARGEELDTRSDIFSLGAVLYEMATGQLAFNGRTSAMTFKAVLDETPAPVTQFNKALPQRLDEIIGKALEKDRDLRYQSAADLRTDLKRLKRDSESGRQGATALAGVAATAQSAALPSKTGSSVVTAVAWQHKLGLAGITIAALIVLGGAGFMVDLWMRPSSMPKLSNYVQLTHDGQPKSLVGTDGSRLYLHFRTGDYRGLAEMSVSGGELRNVSVLPSPSSRLPLGGRLAASCERWAGLATKGTPLERARTGRFSASLGRHHGTVCRVVPRRHNAGLRQRERIVTGEGRWRRIPYADCTGEP